MGKPQNNILMHLSEEPELKAKFDVIKQKLGIRSNSEVIRFLINEGYEKVVAEQKLAAS